MVFSPRLFDVGEVLFPFRIKVDHLVGLGGFVQSKLKGMLDLAVEQSSADVVRRSDARHTEEAHAHNIIIITAPRPSRTDLPSIA